MSITLSTGNVAHVVEDSQEFRRVLALPRRNWKESIQHNDLHKRITAAYRLPTGQQELRLIQAAALADAHDQRGLLAPVPVGHGKTLLSFLLPIVVLGIRRPTLLLPAGLVEKTWRDFHNARDLKTGQYVALQRHWLCHPEFATRRRFDDAVITYEKLGRDSGKDRLDERLPDMLIADEVHFLRNRTAARTRRVERYMLAHPETVFCGMSGTITKRSLRDYWHLMYWALREKMPLPRTEAEMERWSEAIDERRVDVLNRRDPGVLMTFCTEEEREKIRPKRSAPLGRTGQMPFFVGNLTEKLTLARQGYQRRLRESPGVICSTDETLACSLIIRRQPHDPGPIVAKHLEKLRGPEPTTPNGDLLTTPAEVWRHARELATGFYYCWWDQGRFNTCLHQAKSIFASGGSAAPRSNSTALSGRIAGGLETIVNEGVLQTARDTELVKALAALSVGKPTNSRTGSGQGTNSQSSNGRNSSQSTADVATYVEDIAGRTTPTQARVVENVSRLITITRQVKSGDSSAHLATERLQCWVTILRACPELLPIFEAAVDAAKPPPEWMIARKRWNWYVRQILTPGNAQGNPVAESYDGILYDEFKYMHLDSPMQVVLAVTQGKIIRPDIVSALNAWNAVKDSYKINSVAEWVSDSTIDFCVNWVKENGKAIIWVEHRAFAERLAQKLGTGFCSNGGMDANGKLIDDYVGETVVASVAANKEGRNLQAWNRNLVVTAPPTGSLWEQMLGRTHRPGQDEDTVYVDWLAACSEQDAGFDQLMADARYIQDTTGQSQKLLYADHV